MFKLLNIAAICILVNLLFVIDSNACANTLKHTTKEDVMCSSVSHNASCCDSITSQSEGCSKNQCDCFKTSHNLLFYNFKVTSFQFDFFKVLRPFYFQLSNPKSIFLAIWLPPKLFFCLVHR